MSSSTSESVGDSKRRSLTPTAFMQRTTPSVLLAAEGLPASRIAERVGCSEKLVKRWRARYERDGLGGLCDKPRSGRPLTHGPEVRARLIAKACTRPESTEQGTRRERFTYRKLGEAVGMSQAHVILSRADIKPHRTDYWIMSDFKGPDFEERLEEICGLYVDPPENVLVVSIDEKTGIQAKAPTKPDTTPSPGKPARREHEYVRNGTQCLFACLNVKEGDVLGMPSKTRNRFDLIRFLDHLDAEIPLLEGQKIVAITDNLSTRRTEEVESWLDAHPRWRFQFTPTHASSSTRSRSSSRSFTAGFSSTEHSSPRRTLPSRCSRSSRLTTRAPHPSSGPTRERCSRHENSERRQR
jgi:transposase